MKIDLVPLLFLVAQALLIILGVFLIFAGQKVIGTIIVLGNVIFITHNLKNF